MAYEPRTFQAVTTNTPPTGTDPMVDNTASGDVQAIKLINPTAGSVAPWIAQAARAQSLPVALATEDAALLADLLTITAFQARVPAPTLLSNSSATPTAPPSGAYPLIYNGVTWEFMRTPVVFKPFSLGAGTVETTIWTPAAGKKFRLMGFVIGAGAATTILFNDNTGGTLIFTGKVTTGIALAVTLGNGILSGAADRVLTVTRGTSGTLDGTVYGTEE